MLPALFNMKSQHSAMSSYAEVEIIITTSSNETEDNMM